MTTIALSSNHDIDHPLVHHPHPNLWSLQVQDAFHRTRALAVRRDRGQLMVIPGDALGVVLPLQLVPIMRQILVNAHGYDPDHAWELGAGPGPARHTSVLCGQTRQR